MDRRWPSKTGWLPSQEARSEERGREVLEIVVNVVRMLYSTYLERLKEIHLFSDERPQSSCWTEDNGVI